LEASVSVETETDEESTAVTDDIAEQGDKAEAAGIPPRQADGVTWKRILAYGVLPGLALILALGAGYFKWQSDSARESEMARIESVRAATDCAVAMLSYRPDTVDKELTAARDRITGTFRDEYTKLITDVVIPGAKQKQISAVATVPAAAWISATGNHALVSCARNSLKI
jgi:Mce-associated membrane protein